jgi:hypothetical protein
MKLRPGDLVKFETLPGWVDQLPDESRRVFNYCLGRIYPISEIDQNGLLVLDVSKDVDERFGSFMNDIRLEPEFVTKVNREKSN